MTGYQRVYEFIPPARMKTCFRNDKKEQSVVVFIPLDWRSELKEEE